MSILKKLTLLVLGLAILLPVFGCGIGTTPAENSRTIRRIAELDSRMLVDDMALFAQLHRPIRTSRWVID